MKCPTEETLLKDFFVAAKEYIGAAPRLSNLVGSHSEVLGMTMNRPSIDQAANPTRFNIEAIAKLEHEALNRRTPTERISDAIAKFIGSLAFLMLQALLVLTWSAINLHMLPRVK